MKRARNSALPVEELRGLAAVGRTRAGRAPCRRRLARRLLFRTGGLGWSLLGRNRARSLLQHRADLLGVDRGLLGGTHGRLLLGRDTEQRLRLLDAARQRHAAREAVRRALLV